MSWAIAYKASCNADAREPRPELVGGELKSIILNGNDASRFERRVGDAEVVTLCRAVLASSTIVELDLSYSHITDAGAMSIAELLRRNATLQHVNLSFNAIGPAGAKALADALVLNLTVVSFSLRGNAIGDAGGLEIARMLRGNNALVVLDLGQCDLGAHSLISLCLVLTTQPTVCSLRLDKPMLRGPQEVASVVQHMGTMLSRNQSLVDLSLNYFSLGDDHVYLLLPQLVQSGALKQLSLVGNKLTADGGKWVGALLARRPDFSAVYLAGNRIDDGGAAALAASIRAHPSLSILDLRTNAIGYKGLSALAECLATVPNLKSVQVWGNRFEPQAAAAFHKALITTPKQQQNQPKTRTAAPAAGAGNEVLAAALDITTYVVDGVAMMALK
jgi:Ran GTPase-activating protein (RanGAP) involved in mRNA processing and transport